MYFPRKYALHRLPSPAFSRQHSVVDGPVQGGGCGRIDILSVFAAASMYLSSDWLLLSK